MLKRSFYAIFLLLLFLFTMIGCKQENNEQFEQTSQFSNEEITPPEQESELSDEAEEPTKENEENNAAPKPGPAVDWDAPMMVCYNDNYAKKYTLSSEDKAAILQVFDTCGWQQGGYYSITDMCLYVGDKYFSFDSNKGITGHDYYIDFDEKTLQAINTILFSYFPKDGFELDLPANASVTVTPFNKKDEPINEQTKTVSAEDAALLSSYLSRPFTKEDVFSYEDYGDVSFGFNLQWHCNTITAVPSPSPLPAMATTVFSA